jgi:uncharacterized repeat protein (TIGR01451 family)
MRPHLSLAAVLLALGAAVPSARAQPGAAEPLVITAENRTAAAAAESGAPRPDAGARPGDVIRYRLTFTNVGAERIRGVALANPVAAGMRFVEASARTTREDVRTEYSADGGATWSAEPMEEVALEGRRVRRPIAPGRYTHVRWTVDGWVAPGATVVAEFEARLDDGRAPAASTGR